MPGGQVVSRDYAIGPTRKLSIDVNQLVSAPVSARITTSLPSAVERSMYFVKGGSIGGINTIGIAE